MIQMNNTVDTIVESTKEELIERIEEELTKSYNQYRYCKFSTGIELALDVVKRVAKEEGIETE